jgi:4-amino-4-deoxy-L-arabinose transferase-like glycosyltransferase
MKRADIAAFLLSLVAILASYYVADHVFERMPHIEDEMAYVWQAQAMANGKLMLPSPPDAKSFLVPFVIDHNGQRFGKYPPGWPLILTLGILLNARAWVNPILGGFSIWLTYCLGKKLFDERLALLAAALTLTSPFFLLNSGSLLSHPLALVLSLAFALAWLDSFPQHDSPIPFPAWLTVSVAGLSLGVLALTRPLTAIAVSLPFFIHGLILLVRGDKSTRFKVLTIGLLAIFISALIPLWQFVVTGDPMLNPYTLWWNYDKIGFGLGFGNEPGGHTFSLAWQNLKLSLNAGWGDFFGWGNISWVFLPFGLFAIRNNRRAWLIASVFVSLVVLYAAYWIGSDVYGPRYYYEGFYSLTLVSAAGMFWPAESVVREGRAHKWMQIATVLLGLFLFGYNLTTYLPKRFNEMTGLYHITRSMLAPFETAQAKEKTPALVIVHFQKEWTEFGGLLELQNAQLTSPFIFALSQSRSSDEALARDYPDRHVIYYYPFESDAFYDHPK